MSFKSGLFADLTDHRDEAAESGSLTILTWNVEGRSHINRLIGFIRTHDPHIVVLIDCRSSPLRDTLYMHGWSYQLLPECGTLPKPMVMIASRLPIVRVESHLKHMGDAIQPSELAANWLEVEVPAWPVITTQIGDTSAKPLRIGAVHVRGGQDYGPKERNKKDAFWTALLDVLRERTRHPFF